jgi:hypothetical protein
VSNHFTGIFRKMDDAKRLRGKFLSRLFGIMSEEIVKIWARDSSAPYMNEGRPTIYLPNEKRGHTLDFAFRRRTTGETYVTELKCEIEYQGYKFLELADATQLDHHTKPAFRAFLDLTAKRDGIRTRVKGKQIEVAGTVLVWGVVTPEGRHSAIERYGFEDVLAVADMVKDLQEWKSADYRELLQRLQRWSNEMYDGLLNLQADDPFRSEIHESERLR